MPIATTTKLTKGGQTTIPHSIRQALGIKNESRVFWTCKNGRAYITAEPEIPLSITSAQDFWNKIDQAQKDIDAGNLVDAKTLSDRLRNGR